MMRRGSILLLLGLATACVPAAPPPPPAPATQPPATPPPSAPLASDWRDWPLTPGTWRYVPGTLRSGADFGASGTRVFNIGCDRGTRTVTLTPEISAGPTLTIRTSSTTRVLQKRSDGQPPVTASAALNATDPLLDAIAFSRGRFIVEQAGSPPLVLPTYAEIGRVIEDCRG